MSREEFEVTMSGKNRVVILEALDKRARDWFALTRYRLDTVRVQESEVERDLSGRILFITYEATAWFIAEEASTR